MNKDLELVESGSCNPPVIISKGLEEALEIMYKSLSTIAAGRANGHAHQVRVAQTIARECLISIDLTWPKIKELKNEQT